MHVHNSVTPNTMLKYTYIQILYMFINTYNIHNEHVHIVLCAPVNVCLSMLAKVSCYTVHENLGI